MSRRPRAASNGAGVAVRAVGYVRVSTGKQALSPEAQKEKIRAMAALQGAELVDVFVDKESAKEGSIKTRPGLVEILELARRGEVNRIIIAKLDRLTRSVVDLGALLTTLDKHGVSLVSATETWMDTGSAAGRMILNIITAVAQWEREAIGERTREVLQFKRSHHQAYNHTPYGFRVAGKAKPGKLMAGKRLEPIPAEQRIIARMRKMRAAGLPLRVIADRLNTCRIATKIAGGKWHASTIANILSAG
jgi:site-specific DNA recombinase